MIIFLGNEDGYENLIKDSVKDPDIIVSCQYRHKVPQTLIDTHTCVNIHYGTLPHYAGCNPIYWQMMKSGSAGVTLHYMDKNFDSGDIIATKEIPTGGMLADEVYEALKGIGQELFHKYYNGILNGTAPRREQNMSFRKYYDKDDVNFDREKHIDILDDKKIRALHFAGKQYPIIKVGEREYEIRSRDTSI